MREFPCFIYGRDVHLQKFLCDIFFIFAEIGEIHRIDPVDLAPNEITAAFHPFDRFFDPLRRCNEQTGCTLRQHGKCEKHIAVFITCLRETITDPRHQPGKRILFESGNMRRDPVGCQKADPIDVIYQLIRVFLHLGKAQFTVCLHHLICLSYRYAIWLKAQKNVSQQLLFAERVRDHLSFFRADSRDFNEPFRFLFKHLERIRSEGGNDRSCHCRPYAADNAAFQIPDDRRDA